MYPAATAPQIGYVVQRTGPPPDEGRLRAHGDRLEGRHRLRGGHDLTTKTVFPGRRGVGRGP
jgi:hypothetical protein